jgi:hypothetical protein
MAKMRTGRKNGGPGDPPKKTTADREIVSLPMRSLQQLGREMVEDQNRKLIEQRYGKDAAWKYSLNPETDQTVAVRRMASKSPTENYYSGYVEASPEKFRMDKSEYDAIVARNKERNQKQLDYDAARRAVISQNEGLTRGYKGRKAAQAQAMERYKKGIAQGALDLGVEGSGDDILKGQDAMTKAQYGDGKVISSYAQKKYEGARQQFEDLPPGYRLVASAPEWTAYDIAELGSPEQERIRKRILKSKEGQPIQWTKGVSGKPVEAHPYTPGYYKPKDFTEEAPTLQDVPEDRPTSFYGYEDQPVLEKTQQFRMSPRKAQKEEERPSYEDPTVFKGKPQRVFRGQKIKVHNQEERRKNRKERRQQYFSDLMSGSLPTSYRREGKMAKAYFGESELGDSYEGMNKKQIQEKKQSLKKMLKEGGMIKEYKAYTKGELKRANLAEKYLKKAFGGKDEASRIKPGATPSDYGYGLREHMEKGIKEFTPGKMKNYRAQQAYDRKIAAQKAFEDQFSAPNYQGPTIEEYTRDMLRAVRERKKK